MLSNIVKLNQFGLVLSGLNLCATCVGFAIMNDKLDSMSNQIKNLVETFKKAEAIHTNFEFNNTLSEHTDMLDGRKTQCYYTKDQMRVLVDNEYNVLKLLTDTFLSNTSADKEDLLFSILSLAQMLSASVRYFDEVYYFENKDRIGKKDPWHLSHDKWVGAFDRLISQAFLKHIQDFGMLEKGLNTIETDCFYISFNDQIISLKQDIIDNQTLLERVDDKDLFVAIMGKSNQEVQDEIESALSNADVPLDICKKAIQDVAA
jgi:hypothetical protein